MPRRSPVRATSSAWRPPCSSRTRSTRRDQLDPEFHDRVLAEALDAAIRGGVTGHDTTPFLLDHVQRATGGRSLEVNLEVYRGNVALGAEIARAVAG